MGPVAQIVGADGYQAFFLGLAKQAESGHVKILGEDGDDIDLHVINSTQACLGPERTRIGAFAGATLAGSSKVVEVNRLAVACGCQSGATLGDVINAAREL